jgi:hypothetical protein
MMVDKWILGDKPKLLQLSNQWGLEDDRRGKTAQEYLGTTSRLDSSSF